MNRLLTVACVKKKNNIVINLKPGTWCKLISVKKTVKHKHISMMNLTDHNITVNVPTFIQNNSHIFYLISGILLPTVLRG